MHPLLFSVMCLTAPMLCQEVPDGLAGELYQGENEIEETPFDGASSYTDDVDLDVPGEEPPGFGEPPPPPPPPTPVPQGLTIDLKKPVFSHGVITTEEGGVVTGQGIRIQAQKIEYTNKIVGGL